MVPHLPPDRTAKLAGRARHPVPHQPPRRADAFLEHGRLPIDNGVVERLHRRPAVGRRNHLFAGSHAAGERVAIAYSVVATCRLLGINPMAYLADVLPQLARGVFTPADLRALTPASWKAARAQPTAS